MEREEIKYYLMATNKDWKFFCDKGKDQLIELAQNGEPYALAMIFRAPYKFLGDAKEAFKERYCKYIAPFYDDRELVLRYQADGKVEHKTQTEEKQKNYYVKEILGNDAIDIVFLKAQVWSKATMELLNLFKSVHMKKNSKEEPAEVRDFHSQCVKEIDALKKELTAEKKASNIYFSTKELREITNCLESAVYTEERRKHVQSLMERHQEEVLNKDYLDALCRNCQLVQWFDVYLERVVLHASKMDVYDMLKGILSYRSVCNANRQFILLLFEKLDTEQQVQCIESIDRMEVYEILLEDFAKKYNRPDATLRLAKKYLERFGESGDAIYKIVKIVEGGRATINSFADEVGDYCKRWFLDYNYHNRESEIPTVVETLEEVGKLEKLLRDNLFWEEMENCNAFSSIVENIVLEKGFEKGFEMIKGNINAAQGYGEHRLVVKWLQAAECIAMNQEMAGEVFADFVSMLVGGNSSVNERRIMKKIVSSLTAEARKAKELYKKEKEEGSEKAKKESIADIMSAIAKPLETMERAIIGYSETEGFDNEIMSVMRNCAGQIRKGLHKAGLHPMIDIDHWVKNTPIPYEAGTQVCTEEIQLGEWVTCLSMGMKGETGEHPKEAYVKKYTGEQNNGNNL